MHRIKGGGFLAMLLAREKTVDNIKQVATKVNIEEYNAITWHTCSVDQFGLCTEIEDDIN